MPSETAAAIAQGVARGGIDRFRSALATTAEQVRGYLRDRDGEAGDSPDRLSAELGNFASGRINLERFAAVEAAPTSTMSRPALTVVRQAYDVLSALLAEGDGPFIVSVADGGDLRTGVGQALEHLGSAFRAARVIERVRGGEEVVDPLGGLAFPEWTSRERALTPPLIVEAHGSDLQAASLAEFVDGAMKLILVVTEPAPPAPLARLISPGVLIQQTTDTGALEGIDSYDGPGVAAILPNGAAQFVHNPTLGTSLASRLRVHHFPETEPTRPLGSLSVRQQLEDLRQLAVLAQVPSGNGTSPAATGVAKPPATEADKLAAWLLQNTDLTGL